MKLTLSWLREFVDVPVMELEDLVDVFENLGHEVEEARILEPEFSGVVIGRVLDVQPHPNADKVRLTKVDVVVASSIDALVVDSLAANVAEYLSAPVQLRLLLVSAETDRATVVP